ncbi:hypothetical protein VP01_74g4 [Puccinia sorghi]|uniref:Uncharacterized protein n=1 Tax=Puccinia sorghi TaxID=27349 RepID=A0A0L6UC99_9BASI|nr:hypothetical protein VP01_74g4 [Puccinia sorghi]
MDSAFNGLIFARGKTEADEKVSRTTQREEFSTLSGYRHELCWPREKYQAEGKPGYNLNTQNAGESQRQSDSRKPGDESGGENGNSVQGKKIQEEESERSFKVWEREVSQGAYKSVLQWEMKMKVGANPVEVNVICSFRMSGRLEELLFNPEVSENVGRIFFFFSSKIQGKRKKILDPSIGSESRTIRPREKKKPKTQKKETLIAVGSLPFTGPVTLAREVVMWHKLYIDDEQCTMGNSDGAAPGPPLYLITSMGGDRFFTIFHCRPSASIACRTNVASAFVIIESPCLWDQSRAEITRLPRRTYPINDNHWGLNRFQGNQHESVGDKVKQNYLYYKYKDTWETSPVEVIMAVCISRKDGRMGVELQQLMKMRVLCKEHDNIMLSIEAVVAAGAGGKLRDARKTHQNHNFSCVSRETRNSLFKRLDLMCYGFMFKIYGLMVTRNCIFLTRHAMRKIFFCYPVCLRDSFCNFPQNISRFIKIKKAHYFSTKPLCENTCSLLPCLPENPALHSPDYLHMKGLKKKLKAKFMRVFLFKNWVILSNPSDCYVSHRALMCLFNLILDTLDVARHLHTGLRQLWLTPGPINKHLMTGSCQVKSSQILSAWASLGALTQILVLVSNGKTTYVHFTSIISEESNRVATSYTSQFSWGFLGPCGSLPCQCLHFSPVLTDIHDALICTACKMGGYTNFLKGCDLGVVNADCGLNKIRWVTTIILLEALMYVQGLEGCCKSRLHTTGVNKLRWTYFHDSYKGEGPTCGLRKTAKREENSRERERGKNVVSYEHETRGTFPYRRKRNEARKVMLVV